MYEREEKIQQYRRLQPIEELQRKAEKSRRLNIWTQEEMDWAAAQPTAWLRVKHWKNNW